MLSKFDFYIHIKRQLCLYYIITLSPVFEHIAAIVQLDKNINFYFLECMNGNIL